MKKTSILTICVLIGSKIFSLAAEHTPSIKVSEDWIVISGYANYHEFGALPWIHAIQKTKIMSVSIETDSSAMRPADGSKPKNFDGASVEEIAALPVYVQITTTELSDEGANKRYHLPGFRYDNAPAFLQQIIEAVK